MSTVAFLASVVDPRVAAAAARSALGVPCRIEIFAKFTERKHILVLSQTSHALFTLACSCIRKHASPHIHTHPHTLTAEFYKLKDELPDAYKTKDVKTEAKEQAPAASAEKVVNDTPFSLLSLLVGTSAYSMVECTPSSHSPPPPHPTLPPHHPRRPQRGRGNHQTLRQGEGPPQTRLPPTFSLLPLRVTSPQLLQLPLPPQLSKPRLAVVEGYPKQVM